MSEIPIFMILLVFGIVTSSPQKDITGFTLIGTFRRSTFFLSNIDDKRNVSDAHLGCREIFPNGNLVALETALKHNEVCQLLISAGVTDQDGFWTSGQYDGEKWVWYDYRNNVLNPIENICENSWLNDICPEDGCLAIGGRCGWRADDCNARKRYICEG